MKIGILGGTFDPIHNGHLLIAELAKQQANLDQVWFVPAKVPPHKTDRNITSAMHRLKMIELAIKDHPFFSLSDLEIKRQGLSFTVDTVCNLVETYPNFEFFWIAGTDTVKDLPNWHKIKEILQRIKIIGVHRPNVQIESLPDWIQEQLIWIKEEVGIDVSSTYIRKHVTNRHILKYLMPLQVYRYIEENRLYEVGSSD
jgi:nicotinate-nucleotide adenylyltransferase